jgi:hypothetical protein
VDTFSSFALPSTFTEPTTLSRALNIERTTFGQPVTLAILPDLQRDLVLRLGLEAPVRRDSLSTEASMLLQAGVQDVLAGRVCLIPDDVFKDE